MQTLILKCEPKSGLSCRRQVVHLRPQTPQGESVAKPETDYGQLVPKTTRTQDNSYPRQLVPRTTRTQDNSYPGQLIPKTTRTQDDSYPGQLVHRTILTQDNSYPGQLVPYLLAITLQASSMNIQELYHDVAGRVKRENIVLDQYFLIWRKRF